MGLALILYSRLPYLVDIPSRFQLLGPAVADSGDGHVLGAQGRRREDGVAAWSTPTELGREDQEREEHPVASKRGHSLKTSKLPAGRGSL